MGNIVEYNHVHHTNQEQSDTGAIGMGSRDIYERGSVIRYNYVHDTGGYNMLKPGVWEYPHYCWGVYLDDYTSGVHVYGNLIVRAQRGGVMIHGGQDNVIENNIIVDSAGQQIEYAPIDSLTSGRTPGHPDEEPVADERQQAPCATSSPTPSPRRRYVSRQQVAPDHRQSDFNVVWHGRADRSTINLPGRRGRRLLGARGRSSASTSTRSSPTRCSWTRSRMTTACRKDSPALKLGFRPLPLERWACTSHPSARPGRSPMTSGARSTSSYPEGEPAQPPRPRATDHPDADRHAPGRRPR